MISLYSLLFGGKEGEGEGEGEGKQKGKGEEVERERVEEVLRGLQERRGGVLVMVQNLSSVHYFPALLSLPPSFSSF